MPLLWRLLRAEELGDVPANTTAEQLFASSIYAQEMWTLRQQAAALCSAPLVAMSTLAARNDSSSVLGNKLERLKSCSIEQCVHAALLVAREGKQVLFLVRDPKGVTKRLAAELSSPDAVVTTELAAECLHRVRFRQCRSVYELLCELDREQQSCQGEDEAGTQLVALGPLCDLFSGFQTVSGITATGAGLKRMLELAIQRLRATTSIHVSVMEAETS
ncbi:hypothetical protein V7S43_004862 [Phytophthora oleae]|uniref:Uncharacterized protein n=1 Tax=Phytophthora oleae TaxID=2107226 RepID=A0ABD3FUG7_9STRA